MPGTLLFQDFETSRVKKTAKSSKKAPRKGKRKKEDEEDYEAEAEVSVPHRDPCGDIPCNA